MASPAVRSSEPAAQTHTALPPGRAAAGLIPGILLLAVVGYAGKFIEQFIASYGKAHHLVLPNIEYVLWAILIGLAISNTVGVPAIFRSGVATYEFWLKAGIVLLGARFLLGDVRRLGGLSLVLIAIELLLSLTFMTYLGRAFKLKPKLVSLSPSDPRFAESPPSSPPRERSMPTRRILLTPSLRFCCSAPSLSFCFR